MEDYKKKYEEAFNNFKQIKAANKDNKELVDFIEYNYPELKENEDEEVRKIEKKPKEKIKIYDSMDDLIADALIEEIENSDLDDRGKHNRIVWIKSHRKKPAWSEEDEKHHQGCLNLMRLSLNTKPYPYYNDYLWLKSLKEKYTWKPSDEQMQALEKVRVILHNPSIWDESNPILYQYEELMRDLIKLREE